MSASDYDPVQAFYEMLAASMRRTDDLFEIEAPVSGLRDAFRYETLFNGYDPERFSRLVREAGGDEDQAKYRYLFGDDGKYGCLALESDELHERFKEVFWDDSDIKFDRTCVLRDGKVMIDGEVMVDEYVSRAAF